jgi:hypothetical protein
MNKILLPFAQTKYRGNWDIPARAKVYRLYKNRLCQIDIYCITGIPQPTVLQILNKEGLQYTRKGRQYKLYKISKHRV